MSRLLIDLDGEDPYEQNGLRLAFLERTASCLKEFDSFPLQTQDDTTLTFGPNRMRIDGSEASWNRVTVYHGDGSGPKLNIVMPNLLARRIKTKDREVAARAIMSAAIMLSKNEIDGDEDTILSARETAASAALAASAAASRPTCALLPTPWWPCMEHWSMRTSTDDGSPRNNPVDAFLGLAGADLDHVVEALWDEKERGLCPTLVVTSALTSIKHADERPIEGMRAIERWRPLLVQAGLA